MANVDETGNSMNDVLGNATEQEPEPSPNVPRLGGNQDEEDECLQPALEVARLDNILEEVEYLDADFDDDLA